jgi:hypothetical protein
MMPALAREETAECTRHIDGILARNTGKTCARFEMLCQKGKCYRNLDNSVDATAARPTIAKGCRFLD